MSTQEQLEWEARWAKPAAIAAFATVLALIAGTAVRQAVALADRPDDEAEFLTAIQDNGGAFIASSAIQALSFLTLAGALYYLARALVGRRPELPGGIVWLAVLGPVLLAVAGVLSDLDRLDIADQFVASGPQGEQRAEDLLDDRGVLAVALGFAGTLALALAFVFYCINAMRVGLLTRFMGIVGAIIGGLYVLPILSGPLVIEMFWLVALGVLFLGRWPGGRGAAWETGEAGEWPSATARRRRELAAEAPPGDDDREPQLTPDSEPGDADEDAAPRRSSRKRRR